LPQEVKAVPRPAPLLARSAWRGCRLAHLAWLLQPEAPNETRVAPQVSRSGRAPAGTGLSKAGEPDYAEV